MRIAGLMMVTALLAAPVIAKPAAASDKSDVTATIKQYKDALNKNDMKAFVALCGDETIIIDDFAPHVWLGANTCSNWWNAFGADNKKDGIAIGKITLGKAWHVTVTRDHAYAVYPTHFTYSVHGKPRTGRGVWTFALQKPAAGWRIAGWAWSLR